VKLSSVWKRFIKLALGFSFSKLVHSTFLFLKFRLKFCSTTLAVFARKISQLFDKEFSPKELTDRYQIYVI